MLTIATWNVNSIKVRIDHVLAWLAENPVDILALQETKMTDEKFPRAQIEAAGYQVCFVGQPTYNGVAILSKLGAQDILKEVPDFIDPQKRFLSLKIGTVRVVNLYVPNGQSVDSEKYQYKLDWLKHVTQYLESCQPETSPVIVLGDFNIAPEDVDVHDPIAWDGHVLVSAKERAALQKIQNIGYHDVFRQFEQEERQYSWWDYRNMAFRRKRGMRIDLILASSALQASCVSSAIDTTPRTWERPSDHTPVVASFEL